MACRHTPGFKPRAQIPEKPCHACGAMFGRRDDEDPNRFRDRKTCSRTCAASLLGAPKKHIDVFGVMMTLAELAGMLGMNKAYLSHRLAEVGLDEMLRCLGSPGRKGTGRKDQGLTEPPSR